MTDEAGHAQVLLEALGVSGARAAIDEWSAQLKPASAAALLDALSDSEPRETPPGFNGRAYVEEVEACVHALARRFPDALLDALESRATLLDRLGIFGPVSHLRDPRVTRWLHRALQSRDGGQRALGLRRLLDRHDPEVIGRLAPLLKDRHMGVAFAAADGLRRWGEAADIPALSAYAERAPYGGRERAFDAIEAICERTGADLPAAHPGARLTAMPVPAGTELRHGVTTALMVNHGDELASANGEPIRAPLGAVVVGLDHDPEGRLETIVLRYDPRARQPD